MQETSGSRTDLTVGSARTRFADPMSTNLPRVFISTSPHSSQPVPANGWPHSKMSALRYDAIG
jgi:hypothetical protein